MYIKKVTSISDLVRFIEDRATYPPDKQLDGESVARQFLDKCFKDDYTFTFTEAKFKNYVQRHGSLKVGNYGNKFIPLWNEGVI